MRGWEASEEMLWSSSSLLLPWVPSEAVMRGLVVCVWAWQWFSWMWVSFSFGSLSVSTWGSASSLTSVIQTAALVTSLHTALLLPLLTVLRERGFSSSILSTSHLSCCCLTVISPRNYSCPPQRCAFTPQPQKDHVLSSMLLPLVLPPHRTSFPSFLSS